MAALWAMLSMPKARPLTTITSSPASSSLIFHKYVFPYSLLFLVPTMATIFEEFKSAFLCNTTWQGCRSNSIIFGDNFYR